MFSLPLVASGILQQSFNAIDVAVVGKFSSHFALAAVGSTGVIINILINLFIGISVGANVVIANYIGRRNQVGIHKAVATAMSIALISGVFLLILGLTTARNILQWMNTPADVIEHAALYLEIFFIGMPFMMIYNFGAAIMRSMGDTRRPFYSLVIAGIINTILNLLLVIKFGMGVEGVAIATVVANVINAAFILWWLTHEPGEFRLNPKHPELHGSETRKMLQIGIPAGLQGMVFSIANIFIQSSINGYGANVVAGSAAALNFEVYCYFIMVAFCQAAVAFISQNYGAGLYDRCRRIFRYCMILSILTVGAANALVYCNREFFIGLFTTSSVVMHYGIIRLRYALIFQWLASTYEVSGSALRGLGYSMTPTVLTIIGTCLLRLLWIYTVARGANNFPLLICIYPITWVITGALVLGAYFYISHKVYNRKGIGSI